MTTCQVVVYCIGGKKFAVECDTVMAVHPLSQAVLIEIEGAPKHVHGIIFTEKTRIPVISLHAQLGLTQHNDGINTKVIVVRVDDDLFGIFVDQVTGVISSFVKENEPDQEFSVNRVCVRGFACESDLLLPILDFSKLFSLDEAIQAVND